MSILFIMIPMAIVLVAMAVFFFFWAANNKQFDDLDSPAYRILLDDERDAVMQSVTPSHQITTQTGGNKTSGDDS
ncbi:MAG: cbb3-type cytochrome oxidase assembly protein CcoS [Ostreibacterium sp.]